jgi:hypothetical protein
VAGGREQLRTLAGTSGWQVAGSSCAHWQVRLGGGREVGVSGHGTGTCVSNCRIAYIACETVCGSDMLVVGGAISRASHSLPVWGLWATYAAGEWGGGNQPGIALMTALRLVGCICCR